MNSPLLEQSSDAAPRERLLAAADELFYAEGIHVVGIDRLIERAGVAKASLYATFGSKDELVRAYLERHFERRRRHLAGVSAGYATPREQLLGLFEDVRESLAGTAFRGCHFALAAAEAREDESSLEVTERYRQWLRSVFSDLAREAELSEPERLGRQLALIYDGIAVAARLDRDREAVADAGISAAQALINGA